MNAPATHRRKLRLLLSYFYFKDTDLDALFAQDIFEGFDLDMFADSGAFSALTSGTAIDPDEYTAWIAKYRRHFNVVAGPDVIGDAEASTVETERMIKALPGVTVLPTFHVGEPWEHLTHWKGRVPYMAFGGMVPYTRRRKLLAGWCKKAFATIGPGMKVHGFGMTTWPLVREFPWHSIDSSSWTSGFRYAQATLFDQRKMKMIAVAMNKPSELLLHRALLEQYNLRPSELQAHNYDRDVLCGAAVESWQRAEAWVQKTVYLCTSPVYGNSAPEDVARGLNKLAGRIFLVTAPGSSTPNGPSVMANAIMQAEKLAGGIFLVSSPGDQNDPSYIAKSLEKHERRK